MAPDEWQVSNIVGISQTYFCVYSRFFRRLKSIYDIARHPGPNTSLVLLCLYQLLRTYYVFQILQNLWKLANQQQQNDPQHKIKWLVHNSKLPPTPNSLFKKENKYI